jgi:hypothetical protein
MDGRAYGSNTYASIKAELIKKRIELPNPAVYSIENSIDVPDERNVVTNSKEKFGEIHF